MLAEPLHVVAHHEFLLLISPALRGSLPGVVSFSLTRRSTGPGCYEAGNEVITGSW
jgi:hypothetical protein